MTTFTQVQTSVKNAINDFLKIEDLPAKERVAAVNLDKNIMRATSVQQIALFLLTVPGNVKNDYDSDSESDSDSEVISTCKLKTFLLDNLAPESDTVSFDRENDYVKMVKDLSDSLNFLPDSKITPDMEVQDIVDSLNINPVEQQILKDGLSLLKNNQQYTQFSISALITHPSHALIIAKRIENGENTQNILFNPTKPLGSPKPSAPNLQASIQPNFNNTLNAQIPHQVLPTVAVH